MKTRIGSICVHKQKNCQKRTQKQTKWLSGKLPAQKFNKTDKRWAIQHTPPHLSKSVEFI